MGLFRFLNDWKEKADGTLSGPFLEITSSDSGQTSIKMAAAQNLEPTSEPSTPSSGTEIYVDSADNNLKAKDQNGNVVTLVTT